MPNFLQTDKDGFLELKRRIELDHLSHTKKKMCRNSNFTSESNSICTEKSLKSGYCEGNINFIERQTEKKLIEISALSDELPKYQIVTNFDTITKKT